MVVREARRVLEGRVHVLASHLVRSETCAHNEGDERGNEERGGEVVVIGGILVDILASTSGRDAGAVRAGGSVPGHVRAVQGGVGANVAAAVKLISEAASQSRYDALAPLLTGHMPQSRSALLRLSCSTLFSSAARTPPDCQEVT